ncbi:hypothetical protein [Pseudoclavibacter helvolus]|uniref:hypothetical protein n=1 Tax=Pseudoclavibacter helvolus TaxID=255205 RepID=UPI003C74ED3A
MISASNEPDPHLPADPNGKPPASRLNPWLIAAIALAVILLVGGGFAGYAVASGAFVRAEVAQENPVAVPSEPAVAPAGSQPAAPAPAAPSVPVPAPTTSFTGTWVGQISGDRHPYSVTVAISDVDGVVSATATYPELPCTGTWSQTSRSEGRMVVLERMGSENNCFDNVSITLDALDPNTMAYSAQSGDYFITSTLVRT